MEVLTPCALVCVWFPAAFLTDAVLLCVVERLGARFPAVRRRSEELAQGVDQPFGLPVEARRALRLVVFLPPREQQLIITRITVTKVTVTWRTWGRVRGGGASWMTSSGSSPPSATPTPSKLLKGSSRPTGTNNSDLMNILGSFTITFCYINNIYMHSGCY